MHTGCDEASLRMHRVSSNAPSPPPLTAVERKRVRYSDIFFPLPVRGFAGIASSESFAKYSAKQLVALDYPASHTLELLRVLLCIVRGRVPRNNF